jgi:HK97 family phage portal protein
LGIFADSVKALARVIPERTHAVAATVQTWEDGRQVQPPYSYDRNARQGYMLDEMVYACVEFRATSAGEPPVCAYKPGSDEKLDSHPSLDLLNHPNPFMGRSRFWASVLMSQDIGGNAYVEKVRSASGKVVELWPLRPDRVTVIPSATTHIGGYNYQLGGQPFYMPAADVIHFRTRHPLDDYYGLPPIAVGANRIDLDVWVRQFTQAFFRNAGVPSGLINIVRQMSNDERDTVRRTFRDSYSGSDGWHNLLVLDGGQATYEPMGLGMGPSGLALSDLNQINETRICMLYGLAPSLLATEVGLRASSYANRVSDHEQFWANTMLPVFRDLDSTLTEGLADEYPDLDRLEHDFSKISALQEDEDKKHARWRANLAGNLCTLAEARIKVGLPPEPDEPGMFFVSAMSTPTWSTDLETEPEPEPADPALPAPPSGSAGGSGRVQPPNPALPQPVANGRTNGARH